MQYCITKEELDWIINDWPTQWKLPVTRPVTMQSSKPKDTDEVGSLARTNNPFDNTRTTTTHNQPTMSRTVKKRPRRTIKITRTRSQPHIEKKDTPQAGEERT
jgi:hypothetical protein